MNKNPTFRKLTPLAAAISIALSGASVAQDETESETTGKRQIEEVVVTATKRSASIQDISMSVTALGSEQLALGGVNDLSRLEALVPGMQFGSSGDEARIAIRGTRTNNVGTEAEQVVGIFEDGVYVPTSTQAIGSYVDLQRIEVLRGPQGTLYGRNTFGGTINIISNEPQFDEVSGYVHALAGTYNRRKFEGVVNVPLTDTLAFRLAGMMDEHDGYIENTMIAGPSDDMNDQDIQYVRASLKWAPSDDFDTTFRMVKTEKDTNGSGIWGYQQIGGYVNGVYQEGHQYAPANASADFDQGPWKVRRDIRGDADNETTSYTLTTNFRMDWASLKVVANAAEFWGHQGYDSDYTDAYVPDWTGSQFYGYYNDQDTWSIEAQLSSEGDNFIDWMVGYYHFEQDANWNYTEVLPDYSIRVPHWDNQGSYTSSSTGLFANATFNLSDDLRANAGIRFAEDDKGQRDQLDWANADWSVNPPVIPVIPGTGEENVWKETLWKAGLEYDLNADQMAYISASTGYRAGGFNPIAAGVPPVYQPENVLATEVGLKNSLLDGEMTLNVAAYLNQYRDMHAQSFIALGAGGVSEYTENGGEVDAMGVEVELNWYPTEALSVSGSMALSSAEFGDYNVSKVRGLGDLGGRQDLNDPNSPLLSLEGYTPALTPELTMGVQISYDIALPGGSTLRPYVQSYYSSEYYGHDINTAGNLQEAYTKTDLRLIWTSGSGDIEVQGYVQNLENDAQLIRGLIFNPSGAPDVASIQAQYSNPRTAGVALTYRF